MRLEHDLQLADVVDKERLISKFDLPPTEGKTVVDGAVVVAPGAAAGIDC